MKIAVLIICFFLPNILTAKTVADTLTVTEKYNLLVAYRNSCFGQLMLVDSCSKVGDSIAAGYYLMRVNPYYIFTDDQTPQTLDSYLVRHYLIPGNIRKKYYDSFTKVFHKPRTTAYITFERMLGEDQMLRQMLDTTTDSATNSILNKRMQYSDSEHFAFLLKYIHRYGWPSIKNGSIFASVIALHDHNHHKKYFDIIKRATLNGIVDKQVVELLTLWLASDKSFQIELSKYHYLRFDVTTLLKYEMPSTLPLLKKTIAEHCPVKWRFFMEFGKDRTIEQNRKETQYGDFGRCIAKLQREIVNDNCLCPLATFHSVERGLWSYSWIRVEKETTNFYIYILYGDVIKNNDL
ncbi:MAG: hypothetical protein H7329_19335, partial [Opitutaceae bacterium]|nr:hypothetical protein [Cytophagales bacterium]